MLNTLIKSSLNMLHCLSPKDDYLAPYFITGGIADFFQCFWISLNNLPSEDSLLENFKVVLHCFLDLCFKLLPFEDLSIHLS